MGRAGIVISAYIGACWALAESEYCGGWWPRRLVMLYALAPEGHTVYLFQKYCLAELRLRESDLFFFFFFLLFLFRVFFARYDGLSAWFRDSRFDSGLHNAWKYNPSPPLCE